MPSNSKSAKVRQIQRPSEPETPVATTAETLDEGSETQTSAVSELTAGFKERMATALAQREAAETELEGVITQRETELQELYDLRGYGQIGGKAKATRGRPAGTGTTKRIAAKRETGNRVDWDGEVLGKMPKTFTMENLLAHPDAKRKGAGQCYPAISRWKAKGLVESLSQGKYRKL